MDFLRSGLQHSNIIRGTKLIYRNACEGWDTYRTHEINTATGWRLKNNNKLKSQRKVIEAEDIGRNFRSLAIQSERKTSCFQ